jgi:hypothetical protein
VPAKDPNSENRHAHPKQHQAHPEARMEERRKKRQEANDRQADGAEYGQPVPSTDPPEEFQEADGEKEDWDGDVFQARVVLAICQIIQQYVPR